MAKMERRGGEGIGVAGARGNTIVIGGAERSHGSGDMREAGGTRGRMTMKISDGRGKRAWQGPHPGIAATRGGKERTEDMVRGMGDTKVDGAEDIQFHPRSRGRKKGDGRGHGAMRGAIGGIVIVKMQDGGEADRLTDCHLLPPART